MAMVYCRGCAKQLHDSAPTCPQCGAPQFAAPAATQSSGSSWMAIVSLCLGIICSLALFDDSEWDVDTMAGLGLFAGVGLILGVISLNQKKPGHGMAIAGVIMAVISLLCLLGLSAS